MEKQQIYETIIENLPIGFTIVDEGGKVVDFNEAAEKITGYVKEEIIGKSHLEIFHGTSDKNACPLLKHSIKLQEPIETIESNIINRDGNPMTLQITAAPIFNQEGSFIGGVELFRDITIEKKLEREQKNILSMLVHDMKNPLVASLGFLSRLLRGKVEKQQQYSYLELIRDELKTVEGFIRHYLDFVRLERKEYQPQPAPFDIVEVINKQIETEKLLADDNNINIARELWGYPNIKFEKANVMDWSDFNYDVVLFMDTFSHLVKYLDKESPINLLRRMVKEAGCVFFETQMCGDRTGVEWLKDDSDIIALVPDAKFTKLCTHPEHGVPRTLWRIEK